MNELYRMCILKCKKDELFFWVAYVILIIYRFLKSTAFGFDDHGVMYIVVILLLLTKILFMKVRLNGFFAVGVICPFFLLGLFHSWDPLIPVVSMILLASKDIEYRKIVRVSFSINLTLTIAILLFCLAGVVEDLTSIRYLGGNMITCHGMGFNHSSKLPTYFFFLFLEYYYLKGKNIKIIKLLFWLIGGRLIFFFCAERLRFYNLVIAIVLILLSRMFKNGLRGLKRIIALAIYPVLCVSTNILGYLYDPSNPILYALNVMMSGRLYLEKYAFNHYGVSLFGQSINMGEGTIVVNGIREYFYIDSAYVYIFVFYGIIIGLAIIATYTIGTYKAYNNNNGFLLLWFICMAVDSLIGNQMLSVWMCPLLFVPFCRLNNLERNPSPVRRMGNH